ncbi:uncharacterized protein LOC117901792 [Drosophila subobscura]|uniref:uncharacterized protein LOC117901792 n=1 Tax=Drosophila subobscura TaxID=7241 RepID=UPI00155AA93B|nr:uncharacterized protein LOC117901792 [Drosophila subobscura]
MATSENQKYKTEQEYRAQYETRVKQLGHDVFECFCTLEQDKKIVKVASESESRNDSEKRVAVSWQYDMKGFSLEEMTLYQKGNCLFLRAYHKSGGKSLKVKSVIVLSEHVDDSNISSQFSSCGILTITVLLKNHIPEAKDR